jgi:hypothetical protein
MTLCNDDKVRMYAADNTRAGTTTEQLAYI